MTTADPFSRKSTSVLDVALISALTPHGVHDLIVNAARANPAGSQAPWRTRYRMNSASTLRRLGLAARFEHFEATYVETEPSYLRFNTFAFLLGAAYERMVNSTERLAPFRANIFGRFIKSG